MNRRPRVELFAPAASGEEAAAIAAAVERFMRDHAPVLAAPAPQIDAWTRAALVEGVGRDERHDAQEPWIV
jgi:hypothetical protein